MRRILQPGPENPERIVSVQSTGAAFQATLPAGHLLLAAIVDAFAEHGFVSGVMGFADGAFGPLAYVKPALATDEAHAAFYSEAVSCTGPVPVQLGALTFGVRNGAAFYHCHAFWRGADGSRHGGHLLPEHTWLGAPITCDAVGLHDAHFEAVFDAETNFTLFEPRGTPNPRGRFHALRSRPNQDFASALQDYCRANHIRHALIHGGVGSLIGARYADGRVSLPFATEVAIKSAIIADDGTTIDIGLVDFCGQLSHGRLSIGDNPVLMTMELVIEEV